MCLQPTDHREDPVCPAAPALQGPREEAGAASPRPARLTERAVFGERAGFSVFGMTSLCWVEPAHSNSKIYSAEKRQQIGKA